MQELRALMCMMPRGSRSLDGALLTIVGIAPPEFFGDAVGTSVDVWMPMMMQPAVMPGRPFLKQPNAVWVNMMGRLKSGVSQAQATAALTGLWRQILIDAEGPRITDRARRVIAETLQTEPGEKGFGQIRRQFSRPLLVLMTVVGLVLLIACLNVANLLLARAAAKKRKSACGFLSARDGFALFGSYSPKACCSRAWEPCWE